jgi:molybdate transport system regulatory protein
MVMEANKINKNELEVKAKIWIEVKSEVIFGGGRTAILEAIDECGSIRQAASKLGMSYRAVWGKLKATEERLGIQLLDTHIGGRQNGATLTTEAKRLLNNYRQFKAEANKEVERLFEKYFHDF